MAEATMLSYMEAVDVISNSFNVYLEEIGFNHELIITPPSTEKDLSE